MAEAVSRSSRKITEAAPLLLPGRITEELYVENLAKGLKNVVHVGLFEDVRKSANKHPQP